MEFYRETPRFCEGRHCKLLKKAFLETRAARVMNFGQHPFERAR
jgi:hypothetical protein